MIKIPSFEYFYFRPYIIILYIKSNKNNISYMKVERNVYQKTGFHDLKKETGIKDYMIKLK